MDLKEVDILGKDIETHWYYKSKARFMMAAINNISFKKIVDIGAGSGFFSKFILRNSQAKKAACIDPFYEKESQQIIEKKYVSFKRKISSDDLDSDLIILMDVLEHIENDSDFLKKYVSNFKVGSYFYITVPAFDFLWSRHDNFLGHKRRYNMMSLLNLLSESGLTTLYSTYCFSLVFPIVFFVRKFKKSNYDHSDLKKHLKYVNFMLDLICQLENLLLKYVTNRLGGLTVMCLAQKGPSGCSVKYPARP